MRTGSGGGGDSWTTTCTASPPSKASYDSDPNDTDIGPAATGTVAMLAARLPAPNSSR